MAMAHNNLSNLKVKVRFEGEGRSNAALNLPFCYSHDAEVSSGFIFPRSVSCISMAFV